MTTTADDKKLIINKSTLDSVESQYKQLVAEKEAEEREKEEKEKQEKLEAEAEEYAAAARDKMTVWVTGSGKYHVSGCGYVQSYWEDTYGAVKNSHSPCSHCFPDTYCERAYDSYKREYIEKNGQI